MANGNFEIENWDAWGKVIADSLSAIERAENVTSAVRSTWWNATVRAVHDVQRTGNDNHDYLMTWDDEKRTLLIWAVGSSNEIYEVNSSCQCKAAQCGHPCRHRAAKRLIEKYFEAVAADEAKSAHPTAREMDTAPYLKDMNKVRKVEKLGRFCI